MSLISTKVIWTPSSGKSEEFKDVERISIKRASGTKESSATITLKNSINKIITGFSQPLSRYVNDAGEIKFNEGDTVKIYAVSVDIVRDINTSITSTDLAMTGEVAEVRVKSVEKGSKITLKVVDKTWVMLNKIMPPINYKASDSWTAPLIIQDVVRQVTDEVSQAVEAYDNNGDLKFKGEGRALVDARLDTAKNGNDEAGFIESLRQGGSAFPVRGIVKVYKPAYEYISDLSTLEYTNDFAGADDEDDPVQNRTMIFYIDERNKFHWFYPTDTIGTGLSFIEGDDSTGNKIIGDISLTYSTFDIVNLVFFNAGKDLFGSGISSYLYDKNTKSKDFKQVHKPYTEIAKAYIDAEIKGERLTLDNTQTDFTYEGNFYTETTGDYDSGGGITTGWGVSVTSDATYNTALRNQCIIDGKGKALDLVGKKGSPRWKGKIPCKFKLYNAGDLIELTSTRIGLNSRKLRIKTVQHTIDKSGGFSTLTVEEDEKKRGD